MTLIYVIFKVIPPIASLFECNFPYSYSAVYKISTDSASHVPSVTAELLVSSLVGLLIMSFADTFILLVFN